MSSSMNEVSPPMEGAPLITPSSTDHPLYNSIVEACRTVFDPDKSKKSLGTYMILDHIALALELEVPYLYLGYWVPGSSKMDYKVNFKGVEIFQNNSWQPLSEVDKSTLELHPLNTAPVSEQVSSLSLPDSIIT